MVQEVKPPLADVKAEAQRVVEQTMEQARSAVLAGLIELISAVGLTLGLFTRPVALLASAYLLMSMLWGGHFQIGYVLTCH
jgi:uncharacterized membrane protein YphA (DoxX/SURF4 family)